MTVMDSSAGIPPGPSRTYQWLLHNSGHVCRLSLPTDNESAEESRWPRSRHDSTLRATSWSPYKAGAAPWTCPSQGQITHMRL